MPENQAKELAARLDLLEARLDRLDTRLDGFEKKIDKLADRIDSLTGKHFVATVYEKLCVVSVATLAICVVHSVFFK